MYNLRNVQRSLAAWVSSKLSSSSIRQSATSPTHSLKRRARSFAKTRGIGWPWANNSMSGTHRKAGGSGGSGEARRADEKERQLQEVFAYFDGDGDGKISAGEVRGVLKSLGEELSEAEVRQLMGAVDSDGDGFIDLADFIGLNTRICKEEEEEEEELLQAFRMLDTEKTGFITPNGLRQLMLRLWGEQRTVDDCVLMVKPFDLDGDGAVSFPEFKRMMSGCQCSLP